MSFDPLTPREQLMFDELKRRRKMSIMELMDLVKGPRAKRPDYYKSSMTVSVKYLGFKIAHLGYYIERISGRGRGVNAVFELKKLK